ncbi:DNA polymerase III subunit alpha [Candidatus Saccharibacteria bacterium]|nr:DNA polymerase III subunit alpha [Candidatus Saccharibacteria bacterium]
MAKPTELVHLHNHTHYSILDGLQKIPAMLDRVKELGQSAVAITDHGTMSGAIEFYLEAKKRDIKPIIGIETYMARRSHLDKSGKQDANPYHLILLAKNYQGYQNLCQLSTIAWLDGFYYKPRIDRELLEKYSEGLICLSGCAGGELAKAIEANDFEKATEIAKWYQQVFGDDYYLELQDHGDWELGQIINQGNLRLAKELDIQYVITKDCHYTLKEQEKAHDILLCIQTASNLDDKDRFRIDLPLYLTSTEETLATSQLEAEVITEAISQTSQIADKVELEIPMGQILIPTFPVPKSETEESYLESLVLEGANRLYSNDQGTLSDQVTNRIKFELGVIKRMGYCGYMLIVWDLINWSKSQGIITGPGRGSAAGSIVCYCLGITDIDPLKYQLLFERFLNPERISMPDIDMDFPDDHRDEVIQYASQKYGSDQVAHIVTFGVMAARNAVRDTGRVLGYDYNSIDAIAKKIPAPVQGRHIPLADSIKNDPELKTEYQTNPIAKHVIDNALNLEGTIRNSGVHAAGVVIAPEPLVKRIPLMNAAKGVVATQYSMNYVEGLGFLKFDFLGLSNLTIIKNTLRIVKKVYGEKINATDIPLDDPNTYRLFQEGKTMGIFQFESSGMRSYLRQLKPTVFEDIVAMVALYRPGPLGGGFTDEFIKRKNNPDLIKYDHPKLEPILQPTYGVVVYQEQVMDISKVLSGFSGGEADTLRKAMGKKQRDTLAKMKDKFIKGAKTHSQVDDQFINDLWSSLEDFADYGFNKSHAASYALIAIWTAYLKAHYPAAFMAALMTNHFEETEKLTIAIKECKDMGVKILPPDINQSYTEFAITPDKQAIRFGLMAIKNVGEKSIEQIIEIRNQSGQFTDLDDFLIKIPAGVINKKILESMIKVGAFDSLGDRQILLANIEQIVSFHSNLQKTLNSQQNSLFAGTESAESIHKIKLNPAQEIISDKTILTWEKELTGHYISKHPLEEFIEEIEKRTQSISGLNPSQEGQMVVIAGIITTIKKITTKKGQTMAILNLSGVEEEIELVIFPNTYQSYQQLINENQIVVAKGKLSYLDRGRQLDKPKLITEKLGPLDQKTLSRIRPPKQSKPSDIISYKPLEKLIITINQPGKNQLVELKQLLDKYPGEHPVLLKIQTGHHIQPLELPIKVAKDPELVTTLEKDYSLGYN